MPRKRQHFGKIAHISTARFKASYFTSKTAAFWRKMFVFYTACVEKFFCRSLEMRPCPSYNQNHTKRYGSSAVRFDPEQQRGGEPGGGSCGTCKKGLPCW